MIQRRPNLWDSHLKLEKWEAVIWISLDIPSVHYVKHWGWLRWPHCSLYADWSHSSVQHLVNPVVKKTHMDAAGYWRYFSKKQRMGGASCQSKFSGLRHCRAVPVSVRGFQVLLTAVSHGQLVSSSLFWLYLAVGGDLRLVIEGPSRWAVLKRAPLLNCHTASGSMNRLRQRKTHSDPTSSWAVCVKTTRGLTLPVTHYVTLVLLVLLRELGWRSVRIFWKGKSTVSTRHVVFWNTMISRLLKRWSTWASGVRWVQNPMPSNLALSRQHQIPAILSCTPNRQRPRRTLCRSLHWWVFLFFTWNDVLESKICTLPALFNLSTFTRGNLTVLWRRVVQHKALITKWFVCWKLWEGFMTAWTGGSLEISYNCKLNFSTGSFTVITQITCAEMMLRDEQTK